MILNSCYHFSVLFIRIANLGRYRPQIGVCNSNVLMDQQVKGKEAIFVVCSAGISLAMQVPFPLVSRMGHKIWGLRVGLSWRRKWQGWGRVGGWQERPGSPSQPQLLIPPPPLNETTSSARSEQKHNLTSWSFRSIYTDGELSISLTVGGCHL